jgi:hypothetical protein
MNHSNNTLASTSSSRAKTNHVSNVIHETLAVLFALALVSLAGFTVNVRADESRALNGLSDSRGPESQEWRFRVLLDQKEIGRHDFFVQRNGGSQVLRTVADFEYKVLFVKLYEYQHENHEIWQGDCLASIESVTDANGKLSNVKGTRQEETFVVQGDGGEARLPACVMSFAYWNPDFLGQKQLLNSQNGEFLDITVSSPVLDPLEIRGELLPAYRYQLVADELKLDLWYSADREWLGLESETEGGRMLRYELL